MTWTTPCSASTLNRPPGPELLLYCPACEAPSVKTIVADLSTLLLLVCVRPVALSEPTSDPATWHPRGPAFTLDEPLDSHEQLAEGRLRDAMGMAPQTCPKRPRDAPRSTADGRRVVDWHDDRNLDSEARRTHSGFRERQWERRDYLPAPLGRTDPSSMTAACSRATRVASNIVLTSCAP
jgi:hypothetical protein